MNDIGNRTGLKTYSKNLENLLSMIKVKNDGLSIYFGYMDKYDHTLYLEALNNALSCLQKVEYLYDSVTKKGVLND